MPLDAAVAALVKKAVSEAGLEAIDVKIDGRRHVRAWIDRPDFSGVSVEDCASVSRAVKRHLSEEGIDPGAFHVEVLSPGVDRLLTREKDFQHFTGSTVVVHLAQKRGDRRKYRGKLVGLRDGAVVVREDNAAEDVTIHRSEISEARLVPEFPGHLPHSPNHHK